MESLLEQQLREKLITGEHPDPFSVLGMHQVKGSGIIVRTFRPYAERIWVVSPDDTRTEMHRTCDAGLFERVFPGQEDLFDYTLHIESYEGDEYRIHDPYSFDSQLSTFDLQLWGEGNHQEAYRWMGGHVREIEGVLGTHFVVTAPNAFRVSIIGSFNKWDGRIHPMRKLHDQGLWELFIPEATVGDHYKFEIKPSSEEAPHKKADPYAFYAETPPNTASIIYDLDGYQWEDERWMDGRSNVHKKRSPLSIYEVHLGSWRRHTDQDPSYLSYRELASQLIPYVKKMGYTHIELMPVAEHPYDPSWGYQVTGFYAPTSRFGTPHDFMELIDRCHQNNIGVLIDWVPAHFAKDEHGLRRFDGTALYEHADPRQGEHQDWGTNVFNYDRTEVRNFLLSNALYWFDRYHIDGMRVDAVASMLYLDYSREEGQWIPNQYGGRENLEAINLLRDVNLVVHDRFPGVITTAEESTAWPGVTDPLAKNGLGFDYKWNMGWMHDTLEYIRKGPIHRKHHQDDLTFPLLYAFSEDYILPLSHDEVVHMKHSLLEKMPGDDWQQFANLRLLYVYMYGHPGKKLLFMGGEIAQREEWTQAHSLDWHLLQNPAHQKIQRLVQKLNRLYRTQPALHQLDHKPQGFDWIDMQDADNSIISFLRYSPNKKDHLVFILNFTPQIHHQYKVGIPEAGSYQVLLNSDWDKYGGSNVKIGEITTKNQKWHHRPAQISITIPPLAGVILKPK